MEGTSFVSKARTAFHSAAAKAERVFTDFKSDLDSDKLSPKEFKHESLTIEGESKSIHEVKHSRWKPTNLGTKQEWQERFKNIRIGRKGVEDSDKVENSTMAVPFYDENLYLLNAKNDAEAKQMDLPNETVIGQALEAIPSVDVLNTINVNSIPPTSVIKQLAVAVEAGKKFKSLKDLLASSGGSSPMRERAGLSFSAVKLLVLRDKEDKLASGFGDDERVVALIRSLFDAGTIAASSASSALYARISSGELVLRLGANQPADNLTMLETGEPIYSPITQEGPLLTEDLIRETEELVLRTGSVGAGCSQLLSDMQAFKAANPGCILEDFVRWHSPPDWTETDSSDEANSSATRGNLWRELWETAKPVPAIRQTPLFDEDLAVDGILNFFEDIPTSELFQQLLVSLLGLGFLLAEDKLSANENLSKLFYECKDYVFATCQRSVWDDKLDEICQVYETVETMLLSPEDVIKTIKQAEDTATTENGSPAGELKRRFKKLGLNFVGKDKQQRKPPSKDQKNSDENSSSPSRPFASFFDSKSSLFSKKPPKPENVSHVDKPPSMDESDWTLV
ncbi:Rab3 GTPase-activating protein catalytic subunit [Corchorus olitorius]|uniref:Rab3 GTPase-activating protein catalytic subunit n=1 Tax=Corchorus olitorius TaxID=93759 RepID=A0A1R3KBF0_9ROSI|nr:Rab3 GTPase-activating protein catalytic subunit [Corchorus olitorius]